MNITKKEKWLRKYQFKTLQNFSSDSTERTGPGQEEVQAVVVVVVVVESTINIFG